MAKVRAFTNRPELAGHDDWEYQGPMEDWVPPEIIDDYRQGRPLPEGVDASIDDEGNFTVTTSDSEAGKGATMTIPDSGYGKADAKFTEYGPEPGTEAKPTTIKKMSEVGGTAEQIIAEHEKENPTKSWQEHYQDEVSKFGLPDLSRKPHGYDREKFEVSLDKQLGDPFKINPQQMVDEEFNQKLPSLFRQFFKGQVSWADRNRLSPTHKKEWDAAALQWRAKKFNGYEIDRQNKINMRNKMMNKFDNEKKEYQASITRYRTMRTKEEAEKKTIYNTDTGQHMNVKGNVADDIVSKLDKWQYGTAPTSKTGEKVWVHHEDKNGKKIKLQTTRERADDLIENNGWTEGQEYTTTKPTGTLTESYVIRTLLELSNAMAMKDSEINVSETYKELYGTYRSYIKEGYSREDAYNLVLTNMDEVLGAPKKVVTKKSNKKTKKFPWER